MPLPKTHILLLALVIAVLLAVPGRAGLGGEIIFLHYWTDALSGGIDEMASAYNRSHPEQQVRAIGFKHESFKKGIVPMLSNEGAPALFSYWAGARTRSMVENDLIAPIDRAWNEAGLDKRFPLFIRKACRYKGHQYALPLTLHSVGFFYNKAIFQKYGLRPPESWQAFLKLCVTLRDKGVAPIALGCRDGWPAQYWFDFLLVRTAGPDYRERLMSGRAFYDDPEVTKTFELWQQLLDAHYFNEQPVPLSWAEAAGLVHSGQAAMTLMGTWIIGHFEGQMGWRAGIDFDYFPFPEIAPDVPTVSLGVIDVMLVARNGIPDKVDKVLAYFSEIGPQEEMSRGSGALAPSRDVPTSFYTPLQQRIMNDMRNAERWQTCYDLATPPAVAALGLHAFKQFVATPSDIRTIHSRLDAMSRKLFSAGPS
ncbi:ABC transporter substrate-binding protein [Pseudodesulfovibrio sp.]|uniref:ABC transporter substrate-binding protein n=1 Tax=unclassified Pseudodesulfovibrio TaxID=2661612 RepID=UPI003B008117